VLPEYLCMTDGARLGTLYLVPAPLDFHCDTQVALDWVLPLHSMEIAAGLSHWVCENAKSARALLKRIDAHKPLATALQAQSIVELPREVHKKGDHGTPWDAKALLQAALQGLDIGLLSEAGMPAVADPGSSLVRAAHDLGLAVVPLVGPCSLVLALAASGLNGQSFAFVGYVPQDSAQRNLHLAALEKLALQSGQTQIMIETPYRNAAVLAALLSNLKESTRLAVCSGLTLPQMKIQSLRVADWKRLQTTLDKHTPVVFAFGP
jgi:16S rRNA (cytidine1402-2'-O)-methyltransferase